MDRDSATTALTALTAELGKAMVGQEEVLRQVLVGLLAGGHVLVEGVPGLGKTLMVLSLAKTFGGRFTRVQFTPDLMPADVTGHAVFDVKAGEFRIRKGPAFTNLLLADEINRAPAKTQAALLEVMQEQQVTIEGRSFPLSPPFMTLATQNPLELEGTYPLPEAQLDRFLLKILMDHPEENDEIRIVRQVTAGQTGDRLDVDDVGQVMTPEEVLSLQAVTAETLVDDRVLAHAVRIVRRTRSWPGFRVGASPRAAIALVRGARAEALLDGRDYAIPDDVKRLALPALRHRVVLAPELQLEGQEVDDQLRALLDAVEAPRS